MKRFIVRLSLFLLMIAVCDAALGGVFRLYRYSTETYLYIVNQTMTEVTPDILILGSSKGRFHYVPSIMKDSLHLSVFNAGNNGDGIPLAFGFYQGVRQRKVPKLVICDLMPLFDLDEENEPSWATLYPYLDTEGVKDCIVDFDPKENIKLLSNAYKLNSKLIYLAMSLYVDDRAAISNGHISLHNHIDSVAYTNRPKNPPHKLKISKKKEKLLRALIEECNSDGCQIVFTISPYLGGGDINEYSDEISIIREYGKPIYNHLNDTTFINDFSLFSDPSHMNVDGAVKYTSVVAGEVKREL